MKVFLVFVLFLVVERIVAQNLVSNPSFEDHSGCPDNLSQVNLVNGWSSYGGSTDYFNSCATIANADVPNNIVGTQYPVEGNAYCGVFAYSPIEYREFIGSMLSNPLVVGNKYFVSLKISLADSSNFASNNFGIQFSMTAFSEAIPFQINNYAHIYSPSIVTDKNDWVVISGSFIADAAYPYLIIGNFFSNALTDTITVANNISWYPSCSYYYVDDVCISLDSLECDMMNSGINIILNENTLILFPNPTTSLLHFTLPTQEPIQQIIITTSDGRVAEVMDASVIQDEKEINVSHLVPGFYLVRIETAGAVFLSRFIKL